MILLIAIAGLILLMILGSIWWVHGNDVNPKPPLHSALRAVGRSPVTVELSDSRRRPSSASLQTRYRSETAWARWLWS